MSFKGFRFEQSLPSGFATTILVVVSCVGAFSMISDFLAGPALDDASDMIDERSTLSRFLNVISFKEPEAERNTTDMK
jgi:hypothetical protein